MLAQSAVRKAKRTSNGDGVVAKSLASLLQTLAENPTSSNDCSSLPQPGSDAEEILIDVELDGTRYLLMRLPKSEERVQLSPREQEIVRMVAGGHPNKIIASVLNISSWTVCTYLRRIFAKLGVNSRAAMVARASELGRMREYPSPRLHNRSDDETAPVNPNLTVSNIPASRPRISPHQTLPDTQPPQKSVRSNTSRSTESRNLLRR